MATKSTTDFRHAMRGLLRTPQLTIAAVICLGLGLGSTTAIYSAVYTALLRPLPLRDADRLVTVFRTTPQFNTGPFSPANYLDLRAATRTVEGPAVVTPRSGFIQGRDQSAQVFVYRVSGNLFDVLGVSALRGRLLTDADDSPDQPPVVVLSDEFWVRNYGGDPSIVGSTIRLDGEEREVVGVLPPRFRVPHGSQSFSADVWIPLRLSPNEAATRGSNYLMMMGRLRSGVSVAAANDEMRQIMQGIIEQNPQLEGEQLRVLALRQESVRAVRGPLLLLLGAVGFVLLIAVANVASLLLARGVGRRRDIALRAVLGAGEWDVIRPALMESAILTFAGTGLGLLLAWSGVDMIRRLTPGRLPQLAELGIDWSVLGVSLAIAVVVSLVCGIAPALQSARGNPQDALRSSGRTGSSRGHQRFLRMIVAAEVGLTLVLLLGAGLVLRGFGNLISRDPGFDPGPLLTLDVSIPPDRYEDRSTQDAFLAPALAAIRGMPGVQEAGAINLLPYVNWGWNFNIRWEGRPVEEQTRLPITEIRSVSPGLFAALGARLRSGRLLTADDALRKNGPYAVVVNEALVRRDFPGEDPLGKRYHVSDTVFATVVGVVSDIRNFGPESPPRPGVYWVYGQSNDRASEFPIIVRVNGDPARFAQSVRTAILSVEPLAAIQSTTPMNEIIAKSVGRPRFYLALLAIFAGAALILSIAGLYGLMSYAVAQRTREIGVRAALGSTPRRTLRLVMRQGLGLVTIGVVGGLLGGVGLTRLLGSLLYGVSPLDVMTWAAVTFVLGAAGAVAIFIPARRAAGVQPLIALREE